MSRTYRKREERYWWTEEEYKEDEYYHQRWGGGRNYYAAIAYYYSDSQDGMWQVPKWWKKQFRIRPFRNAEKMCLRKEMQAVDYGNIIYPIKKCFDEYYW